jgi:hypothetical protein
MTVMAAANPLTVGSLKGSVRYSQRISEVSELGGELTSQGKEVAFIVAARERFSVMNHGSIK